MVFVLAYIEEAEGVVHDVSDATQNQSSCDSTYFRNLEILRR